MRNWQSLNSPATSISNRVAFAPNEDAPTMTAQGQNPKDDLAAKVKRLEAQLTDERKRFDEVIEHSPDGLLFADARGVILRLNPEVERMFGYSRMELLGQSVDRLVPDAVRPRHPKLREEYMDSPVPRPMGQVMDIHGRRKDGVEFPVVISLTPYTFDGQPQVMATIVDLSERRATETALRGKHHVLATEYEALKNCGAVAFARGGLDGRPVDVNQALVDFTGYSEDELKSMTFAELTHPDDVAKDMQLFQELIEDKRHYYQLDKRYVRKDGEVVWGAMTATLVRNEDGTVASIIGLIEDITDAVNAETELMALNQELGERKAHLLSLVESIPDAIITADADGTIEEVNPAAVDMFRTGADELTGKSVLSLFPPQVAKTIDLDRSTTGGLDFLKGAVMVIDALRSDGQDFRAAVSVNSFRTGDGPKLLWILKDVSAELRYEKERQSLNRALEEKNRELESIIYAASHDLRSPLVNLQGFGRELQKGCAAVKEILQGVDLPKDVSERLAKELDGRVPEAIEYIDAGSRKMDQLIRGLLRLSRLGRDELRLKVVDMNKVAKEVLRSLEFTIREENVEIELGDLPPCVGDEALLNQVLSNLLDNSLKYLDSSRKGSIKVSGRFRNRESEYIVEDNGIGIPDSMLHKVFEVFHRLDPKSPVKGEGLGLSIVRRILDRHNGGIRGERTKEHGVRFVFTLPAPRPGEFDLQTKKVHHAGT